METSYLFRTFLVVFVVCCKIKALNIILTVSCGKIPSHKFHYIPGHWTRVLIVLLIVKEWIFELIYSVCKILIDFIYQPLHPAARRAFVVLQVKRKITLRVCVLDPVQFRRFPYSPHCFFPLYLQIIYQLISSLRGLVRDLREILECGSTEP